MLHIETDCGDTYSMVPLSTGVAVGLCGGFAYGLLERNDLRALIDYLIGIENQLPTPPRHTSIRIRHLPPRRPANGEKR